MKPACFGTVSTNCLADMSKGYPCWQKEGCAKETRRRWIWKLYKEEHLDVGEITKKVLGKQFVRAREVANTWSTIHAYERKQKASPPDA